MNQGRQSGNRRSDAAKAVNLHLGRLSSLQRQLHSIEPHEGCSLKASNTCLCQQVAQHAAAAQEVASAHAPLDRQLLLDVIKELGSLGAALLNGRHPLDVHLSVLKVLRR